MKDSAIVSKCIEQYEGVPEHHSVYSCTELCNVASNHKYDTSKLLRSYDVFASKFIDVDIETFSMYTRFNDTNLFRIFVLGMFRDELIRVGR